MAAHVQQTQAKGHCIHRKATPNLKPPSFWGRVCLVETQEWGTGMLPWAAEKHSPNIYWTSCPWTPLVHKRKAEVWGESRRLVPLDSIFAVL